MNAVYSNYKFTRASQINYFDQQKLNQYLKQISPELKPIIQDLFNNNLTDSYLINNLPIQHRIHTSQKCGAKIGKYKNQSIKAYKCYDCQIQQDSIFCANCFENGDHKGHRYVFYQNLQGICDCGNQSIIKEAGFCIDHELRKKQYKQILKQYFDEQNDDKLSQVTIQSRKKYEFYINQLIQWIFKLYHCNYTIYAQILLKQLINYIKLFNTNNQYFIQSNQSIFFNLSTQKCIADHLIDLLCKYQKQKPWGININIKIILSSIAKDNRLQSLLLLIYLRSYSRNPLFYTSSFFNHLKHLFTQPQIVKLTYEIYQQQKKRLQKYYFTLKYDVINNYYIFYQQFKELLQLMQPQMARLFIKPYIDKCIPYPYMKMEFQGKYEEICSTEHLYYELLIKIISLIIDKGKLKKMMKNYMKMYINNVSQPDISAPKRIIALIILKYSDSNLQNLKKLNIDFILEYKNQLFEIFKVCLKSLIGFCKIQSFKYSLNWNWKYSKYYVKNNAIKYDMLFIQIISKIFSQQFQQKIQQRILFFVKNQIQQIYYYKKYQKQQNNLKNYISSVHTFKANMLIFLGEIIYSRIPQIYFSSSLNQHDKIQQISKELLQSIFNSLKEIDLKVFQDIQEMFFANNLPNKVIKEVADYDKKHHKYVSKKYYGECFNFNILFSFSNTQIYNLYKDYVEESPKTKVVLTNIFKCYENQQKSWIFNDKIIQTTLNQLIDSAPSVPKKCNTVNRIIKTNKILKNLYENTELYKENVDKITSIMKVICLQEYKDEDIKSHYSQNYYLLTQKVQKQQQSSLISSEDFQKRKQKQRAKRQFLMQKNKVKLMQQTYKTEQKQEKDKQQSKQSPQNDHFCLICKQGKNLCYLAKIDFTQLMFHRFNKKGQNMTLFSCYHPIHYNCFIQSLGQQQHIKCPLCKQFSNTIIPINLEDKATLAIVQHYYEYRMQLIKSRQICIQQEFILYLFYLFAMNFQMDCSLSKQEEHIVKFIHKLIINKKINFSSYRSNISIFVRMIQKIIFKKYTKYQIIKFVEWKPYSKKILQELNRILQLNLELYQVQDQTQKEIQQQYQQNIKEIQQLHQNKIFQIQQPNNQKIMTWRQEKISQKYIEILQQTQKQNIKENNQCLLEHHNSLRQSFDIPSSINQFLSFRDNYLNKYIQSNTYICLICHKQFKILNKNSCEQSLFINLSNANFIISFKMKKNYIFGLYQNEYEQNWKISQSPMQYKLNKRIYQRVLKALINNNLDSIQTFTKIIQSD